jgi:hypothetical protein
MMSATTLRAVPMAVGSTAVWSDDPCATA